LPGNVLATLDLSNIIKYA